ncbi:hypothetical protein M408DRAFT_24296 [Serendipita vermifera MAFF 305830]|uniref:Uncharacterized protein n=1 Tax=Serendipita vermifera MAFF 305830 TaxID=933852 RepID=A0A0C2XEU1_SERVB|nr:hypothetical protein M408DRAFT_24296 [Serendipita vermifera MAFF 305830]
MDGTIVVSNSPNRVSRRSARGVSFDDVVLGVTAAFKAINAIHLHLIDKPVALKSWEAIALVSGIPNTRPIYKRSTHALIPPNS